MAHSAAHVWAPGSGHGPNAEFPPPETPKIERRTCQQPCRNARVWYETLRGTFGDQFLSFMTITFFGLRGLNQTLITLAMLPMFKAMNAGSSTFQLATMVAQIPLAMKGWLGVLTDCFPLLGYHKRSYLIISSGLGVAGIISVLLSHQLGYGIWVAAGLFSLTSVHIATFDLLCQSKYTQLMNENGGAPQAVSFAWSSTNLGMFLASVIVFAFLDALGFRVVLSLTVPYAVLALYRACQGDLPEERLLNSEAGVQWNKLQSEAKMFGLAACLAVGAVLTAASAVAFDREVQSVFVLSVSIVLLLLTYLALPRTLANCNLYMFLATIAYFDLSGPLGFYYTADSRCVHNGPGFSYGYYLAVTSSIGAIGGCIGSVCFQGIQSWSFRKAFSLTILVQTVASLFDWIIVKRLNIAVGISDKAMFFFGDAACTQIAIMLANMPYALLTSLLCPRGAEATVFAILASFQNFGTAVASVLGVWLTRFLQIHAGGGENPDDCDFTNLGTAILIAHCALPMLVLPATWILLPDVRMNDEQAFELLAGAQISSVSSSESSDCCYCAGSEE